MPYNAAPPEVFATRSSFEVQELSPPIEQGADARAGTYVQLTDSAPPYVQLTDVSHIRGGSGPTKSERDVQPPDENKLGYCKLIHF